MLPLPTTYSAPSLHELPPLDGASCAAAFPDADRGTGEIIQLTLATYFIAVGREPVLWEKEMMVANLGHPQWSVAAMMLGINSLHYELREWLCTVMHAHWTPLGEWRSTYGPWLNALRRCPMILGLEHIPPEEVLMLRKVLNCTWRDKSEADWVKEEQRRTVAMPAHTGLAADGTSSRLAWVEAQDRHLRDLAHKVVGATIYGAHLDTLDDWWGARWAWCPSGSSSQRWRTDHVKAADERLGSGARPSKKAVFEELPDDYAFQVLACSMPAHAARASTKPEPGGKARSLYAVSDEAFIASGYASVHMEKHMNVWGMKAKQTPSDVASWVAADLRRGADQVWLSLDYSDYNTEHELGTLQALNIHLAAAWYHLGRGRPWHADKVAAALWTAAAHAYKPITGGGPHAWRAVSGLFSGDRDTARDNTLLHGVYSRIAQDFLRYVDARGAVVVANYTGDDEDVLMSDWQASLLYMQIHRLMGFELKTEKQLSGECHEFLQRIAIPGRLPARPLFATLAQFASGNWYKDVHTWYDSAIQSISDNVWEMVTRGMPMVDGRRLAVRTINIAMRVYDHDASEWVKLEWWPYRHCGMDQHPLWYGTKGATSAPPAIAAKPDPAPAATGRASAAWVRQKKYRVPLECAKGWEVYVQHCRREGYASLYTKQRAQAHRDYALRQWPRRTTVPEFADAPPPPRMPYGELRNLLLANPTERRPPVEDEVLARMGLDKPLVVALGGLDKVVQVMPPDVLKHYSNPQLQGYLPVAVQWEDPAIRAWYAATAFARATPAAAYQRQLDRWWPKLSSHVPRPVLGTGVPTKVVIMAGNASGKTTWGKEHPWCADMDAIVASTRMSPRLRDIARHAETCYDPAIARTVDDVLQRQGYCGIMSQMRVENMVLPPRERQWIAAVYIVQPPRELIVTRMRERGWPDDKIERRLLRFANVVAAMAGSPNLTHAEITSARRCDSLDAITK